MMQKVEIRFLLAQRYYAKSSGCKAGAFEIKDAYILQKLRSLNGG
jgi:hypothetical protein